MDGQIVYSLYMNSLFTSPLANRAALAQCPDVLTVSRPCTAEVLGLKADPKLSLLRDGGSEWKKNTRGQI